MILTKGTSSNFAFFDKAKSDLSQILVWHEMVNDIVGKTPVAVTYCPLCFTNQVFNRTMNDGQILEFGTSGKLYNSNLVMYDKITKSLWSQGMSQAIITVEITG
jgi:uncharacterized protein DUF3179